MGCKQQQVPDMDDIADLVLPAVGLDHVGGDQHTIICLNRYIISRSELQRLHNPPLKNVMGGTTHMHRALKFRTHLDVCPYDEADWDSHRVYHAE